MATEFLVLQTHSKLKKLIQEGFQEDKLLSGKFATLGSKSFELKLPAGVQQTSVSQLKGLMEDQEAIPIETLEILKHGVVLPDESILGSHFIRSGMKVLYVRKDEMTKEILNAARGEGGTKEKHKTPFGSETMTIIQEQKDPNIPDGNASSNLSTSTTSTTSTTSPVELSPTTQSTEGTAQESLSTLSKEETEALRREQRQKFLESYQKRAVKQ